MHSSLIKPRAFVTLEQVNDILEVEIFNQFILDFLGDLVLERIKLRYIEPVLEPSVETNEQEK